MISWDYNLTSYGPKNYILIINYLFFILGNDQMEINLGYVEDPQRILIRSFNKKKKVFSEKIISSSEVTDESLQALLYDQEINVDELGYIGPGERKLYPLLSTETVDMDRDKFKMISINEAFHFYQGLMSKWLLRNNLSSLEEIFPICFHLKSCWNNDRHSFFEEFWYLLKSNLATSSLRIIFNDLKGYEADNSNDQDENKKSKDSTKESVERKKSVLKQSSIFGHKRPEMTNPSEAEIMLLKKYNNYFNTPLEICEFNPEFGELVMACSINYSPFLILANVAQFDTFQKSLLFALLQGLQDRQMSVN